MTTLMTARRSIAVGLVVLLAVTACGSEATIDDPGGPEAAQPVDEPAALPTPIDLDGTPIPVEPDGGIGDGAGPLPDAPPEDERDDEAPIPVEPDGGIGDGAGPLPDAPPAEVPTESDWHGAEVAVTNCPGTDWKRIDASAFSFSVPVDFVDQQAQGIDSEVGIHAREGIDVIYDYGWYSGTPSTESGPVDITFVNYSGFIGTQVVVPAESSLAGRNSVAVHFAELDETDGQANRLTLIVQHERPEDEIIGRCIVGSIEWKIDPPG